MWKIRTDQHARSRLQRALFFLSSYILAILWKFEEKLKNVVNKFNQPRVSVADTVTLLLVVSREGLVSGARCLHVVKLFKFDCLRRLIGGPELILCTFLFGQKRYKFSLVYKSTHVMIRDVTAYFKNL